MPKTIKTKSVVKDIKVFDRTADVGTHMRNVSVKAKDAAASTGGLAEKGEDTGSSSPSEYASERVSGVTGGAAQRTAGALRASPVKKAAENMDKARGSIAEAKRQFAYAKNAVRKPGADQARRAASKQAQNTARHSASGTRKAVHRATKTAQESGRAAGRTANGTRRTVKTASKAAGGTRQAAQKGIKTAGHAAKTVGQTARATQRAAQAAAKAAKTAAQATRAGAQAAARTARAAARATVSAVKAIIAATKALIAVIAAGGWVAVAVILIICMVGLLLGSVFGIFFSGEDSGSGYTMPQAIREINQEYTDKIAEIRTSNTHDEVVISGTRAEWKEVLALYAIKVNTDPANPQDVATVDEGKRALLASVFWDMNTLEHRTETKEVVEVTVEDDGNDGFISTETTVTKTILYITVSHKTAMEMAVQYGFSAQQKAQLAELLSDEYASLWSAVLYGIHNGSGDIVEVAISQIGNTGGAPYWSWYGFSSRVEWCATFVSWCANECGYIDSGIIPKFAACQTQGIPWFKERGLWQEPGYIPAPGDIIFFDWGQDGISDHVGIVEYVEGEVVHTVEGNTSDSVARRSYRLNSRSICGYGTPMY
jgi:hypothetical protein